MGDPNVVGFGIGATETEDNQQWVLKVLLRKRLPPKQMKSLETSIDRVPVFYEVSGEIKALRSKPQKKLKP